MKILETHIVPEISEEIRLQEYAPQVFTTISSRSGIKKAIKREEILIDGKVGKTSDWIRPHQRLELLQQERKEKKVFQLKMEVIFEDEYLAVIYKPPGYPTSGNFFKTIENALPFNLKASEEKDTLPYPLPVHRLDNPTSGLLIVAKTRSSQAILSRNFEDKGIQKTYIALVEGEFLETAIIEEDLDGKKSTTKIRPLNNFTYKGKTFLLLEVQPETGRTHQIRKHLSMHNMPIVGDVIYGSGEKLSHLKGLFLSATGLEFQHPISLEQLSFKIPFPKRFNQLDDLTNNPRS